MTLCINQVDSLTLHCMPTQHHNNKHEQEEHGWSRDKEMIEALSLTRYGVQYTHTTVYPGGGVRVIWELPVSSIAGVALVSSGIGMRITVHSSVLYANKQEHVPVNRRKGKPMICDAEAMSEV
jgi:hypothetical protein